MNALLVMAGAGLGIIGAWWVSRLIASLPVFMWRRHRDSFSPVRHVAIPVLGSLTLIVPFVELCQPGQPAPYSAFPFIALAIAAASAVTGFLAVRRHPRAGAGEGAAFPGT